MQNQSDPCLSTEQVAQELGLPKDQVRALIQTQALEAEKLKSGRWCIRLSKLNEYQSRHSSPSPVAPPRPAQATVATNPTQVKPDMIEISVGITAVSAAVMTLVPGTLIPGTLGADVFRGVIYWGSLVVGFISLYTSLWLLGKYMQDTHGLIVATWEEKWGLGHITALLSAPHMGPYWFMAVNLVLLFIVLGVVGYVSAY